MQQGGYGPAFTVHSTLGVSMQSLIYENDFQVPALHVLRLTTTGIIVSHCAAGENCLP